MAIIIDDYTYGKLLPYVKNSDITDINWNGESLWLNHLHKGRYKVEDFVLDVHFVEQFAQKLKNSMGVDFNPSTPVLEAETEELRISIIHYSVASTGTSISIRKTPAIMRLNRKKMLETNYCTSEVEQFLEQCVRAGMSIAFCGLPGAGKTELLKTCTSYIPANQRVITIEDTLEIRYRKINPGKDSVELKVSKERFTYEEALKSVLRQLPDWLLLSEARSVEVKYLIECMSNGTHCMTTLHADDVRKIPDRIMNMLPEYKENSLNHIYSFLDVGVLVEARITEEGIFRQIAQIGLFSREGDLNKVQVIYDIKNGMRQLNMAETICRKFEMIGPLNSFPGQVKEKGEL